ncbi:MAG: 50S ribosomal protein L32 [Candidatus Levyibacteriota bacterium]
MPHEPKRRHSTQRKGKRRAEIVLKATQIIFCPNCKAPSKPHVVCKNCGYYAGSKVLAIKEKAKITTTTSQA